MSVSKPIKTKIKLQLVAGSANPAPPVGSMLGPTGINLMKFCKEFNDATMEKKGNVIPVIITIYIDKTYSIEYKTSPVSNLIKKYAKIEKGATKVGKDIVGALTQAQVAEIAKIKMQDLNTLDFNKACDSVRGSAKSMGVKIIQSS